MEMRVEGDLIVDTLIYPGSIVVTGKIIIKGTIEVGGGITAGGEITAGDGWQIFAGLRLPRRDKRRVVRAKTPPANLICGEYVAK